MKKIINKKNHGLNG